MKTLTILILIGLGIIPLIICLCKNLGFNRSREIMEIKHLIGMIRDPEGTTQSLMFFTEVYLRCTKHSIQLPEVGYEYSWGYLRGEAHASFTKAIEREDLGRRIVI
jgi:hypothetical protein